MAVQRFAGEVEIYDNGYCELYLSFDWGDVPLNLDPLKPDLGAVKSYAQKWAALLGWKESYVKRMTPQALGISVMIGNRE